MIKDKAQITENAHNLCVAPMMDWTDRHCRFFHRLLAPHALLYTEMVTTGALIHGDVARHLRFHAAEHPVALQLGGSSPDDLAHCAALAAQWGYDEINLNCGCPSDRVQQGRFGACLMNEPETVAACVRAMAAASPLPVTVKCRIGVDARDDDAFLDEFIDAVAAGGAKTLILHARKALLKGLSPKENREIPPLRYESVARQKTRRPDLRVILNGGLKTIDQIQATLSFCDGVMIGREAYQNPYRLAEMEHALFGTPLPDRLAVLHAMGDYVRTARIDDPALPVQAVTRHILGLYHGERRGRHFRRRLTEDAQGPFATPDLFDQVAADMAGNAH